MVIKELFPLPVLFHEFDPFLVKKIKDLVIPRLDVFLKKDYKTPTTVETDFFSKRIIDLDEIPEFAVELNKCKNEFEKITGCNSSYLVDYWIQNYKEKQYHDTHNHGRVEIAGVYYIQANDQAGEFEIFNPNLGASIFVEGSGNDTQTKFNQSVQSIKPKEGGLILFPGYVNHRALPGGPNCIRTSLAFNFYPIFFDK